jgi:hypothetical protein
MVVMLRSRPTPSAGIEMVSSLWCAHHIIPGLRHRCVIKPVRAVNCQATIIRSLKDRKASFFNPVPPGLAGVAAGPVSHEASGFSTRRHGTNVP